ncbi:Calcium channel subunit Cch1 [Taphrina deformans PYCC 5710]|uniref:Calcium-channel protein CCH1 n=1 Tax=Taphrina deformans (strain PYCC 5710 / ATCC 11124 / CBS 356.35 / IMI 108563 / JCM 9778 / NBRC 8474) TaxID=1097556 RepID=R4XFV7_TAPDE|nr:Calcium channel subunit Cch1 [Taphrina deformans PYCC 5710]|eukprot:CCG82254.1 Calcium channel subunit Cch1 [Taphrina deformans PYCC 5710]
MRYSHDGEVISLQSIDLAERSQTLNRMDSWLTNDSEAEPEAETYDGDEEMSHGLTSHAQRISGASFLDADTSYRPSRTPPRTPRSHGNFRLNPFHGSPSSAHRRSASPLGRKVSLAVHKASARIVNLSNDANGNTPIATPQLSPPSPAMLEKDYFSNTRPVDSPQPILGLQGKTLGIFGSENKLRQFLCDVIMNPITESIILLLIVFQCVVLTIDSSYDGFDRSQNYQWGLWTDWALLAIFICYTVEVLVRTIVSGLWRNPEISHELDPAPDHAMAHVQSHTVNGSATKSRPLFKAPLRYFNDDRKRDQRFLLMVRRAYLRHSFNRIDFIAVLSYWVYVGLAVSGAGYRNHIHLFKALSCLRILRLLNITRGTATILKSLKKAAPLLVNVAFFVGFFWIFIAVIGVQSFKGSFRRQCVWVDPAGIQQNQTQYLQFCGGQWVNGKRTNFLLENWQESTTSPKGYICPEQSWCVQDRNPYNGSVSFDNILNSMELVFVIMSSNTFTDLMYYTMDSDYFTSAFFFIAGTLLLTFWLMSLVIAVITTSFQVIRDEQHSSAFVSQNNAQKAMEQHVITRSKAYKLWQQSKWIWVALILADLITQAFKSASMPPHVWDRFELAETIFTIIFAVEIVCRFAVHFPHWRDFLTFSNLFDLFLVVVTCVIQIPPIKHSGSLYRWLTVFQIVRSYRVIQAIPLTRDLILKIFGNAKGFINLIFFVFCAVFIAALVASQLFRGEAPQEVYGEVQEMTFKNIFNSFIAMYQILSSENWSTILYDIQSNQILTYQAWIGAIFIIVWFIFSQNILMSMFIAVLQENFEVSEEDKRREQVRAFVQKSIPTVANNSSTNLTIFTLFKKRRSQPSGTTRINPVLHETNVIDFLDQQISAPQTRTMTIQDQLQGPFQRFWQMIMKKYHDYAAQDKTNPFNSTFSIPTQSALSTMAPHTMAYEIAEAQRHRRAEQLRYVQENPAYDKALWCIGPSAPLRRACQTIVGPSVGERLNSDARPSAYMWYIFTAFMYLCTVALVVLACIITPIYQKGYRIQHQDSRFAWFTWCDLAFTLIFSGEFLIKILADGFWLTPNAYLRNTWNKIDLFVLVSLWINLIADILDRGSLSRAFRAFKALRALRLVNISDATKETFYDVLIAGFWNIAGAAIISLALLIPMAIWGLNMFSGLLKTCNDDNVDGSAQCYNEYSASPNNWDVWAPRSWENPQVWTFDSFGTSLLILFEIVSQEGWIDVMQSAMAITGRGQQPEQDASAVNAIFFIIFNLLGAVFVLTLFIAVIIQNYSERSGIAYLTTEQRSWQEMRLLLKQVRPSRRPVDAPKTLIRKWCFFAVKKQSVWNRFLTVIYCGHVILLMTEHFPEENGYSFVRNLLFLVTNLFYVANVLIRVVGLGWSLYIKSRWNIYNLVVVPISTALTVVVFRARGDVLSAFLTADKVFLVLIAMNLIQAIDPLDQLFKTTAGSAPALASLMATWLVLFVTFAIAFNQIFGLTKIGSNGSDNINFRTIPKALVVLFRMSCGEGWNSIMHDHAVAEPYCNSDSNFFESDCGSESWAYFLFIAWNILSMYIFVNIVISLVYNNFSYVYQRAGKMSSISRAEIRRFKTTWAEFDDGSGHIHASQVARFLSKLDGAFEVRIYPAEYSVPSIMANCRISPDIGSSRSSGLDLYALNEMTNMMDVDEIRRRRLNYRRLYAELMHHRGHKGISFTTMLLSISHNKFVDENKSLGLGEFLYRRNVRLETDHALAHECIVNFFATVVCRRKIMSMREPNTHQAAPPRLSRLQIPRTTSRAASRSPSPTTPTFGTSDRFSWTIGRPSISSSQGTPSRQPSPGIVSPHDFGDGVDYSDLLAGSAWSDAINKSPARTNSFHSQAHAK